MKRDAWPALGLLAWVAMAVAVSLLFLNEASDDADVDAAVTRAQRAVTAAEEAIDRIDREGLERDYELCAASNDARAGIVAFIESLVGEASSPQAQTILDLAHVTFAPIECPPDPSP